MPDALRRRAAIAICLVLVASAAVAARPTAARAHDIPGFERFLYALGQVESGGRYDAYNATSGAYGKYQIIPSSWRAWAREVLGDAYAPMTPENQEKVARYKIHQVWHYTGSWPVVAYWWLTGRINRDLSTWSTFARTYVNKIMAIYNGTASTSTSSFTVQETYQYIAWGGSWASAAYGGYLGGAVRWSKQAGSTATLNFTGKSIAWLGPKGPTRGKARVFVDGVYVRTVDLYASSFQARATVFAKSWTDVAKRSIRIEVLGTAGRPVVAIDAFRVGR